ncbi:chymotrypsin-2-like [Anticarsia gemmatalis]|uniref:chymotrypsin-2-like n=1 Tax=Anticarsia gemmatalis TaxID=129554 RepID=UPI003F775B9A
MFVFIVSAFLVSYSVALPLSEEKPEPYIVNGTTAGKGSHPYMVNLSSGRMFKAYVCGGSLITQRTILTAAHCTDAVYYHGELASSLRATLGSNHRARDGTEYPLLRNVTHPNYVTTTNKNDISLLITTMDVVLTDRIKTISLCFEHIEGGVDARVAGWGLTEPYGTYAALLLEINVTTIDTGACAEGVAKATLKEGRAFPFEGHIELCTYHSPGCGTCSGDSGSPLKRVDNGQQIGVVSWGFPCARGAPDMYARISAFKDFLQENIVHPQVKATEPTTVTAVVTETTVTTVPTVTDKVTEVISNSV